MRKRDPKDVEAQIQQTRPYITLDYSTFKGMSKPARFIDEEYGEWWGYPSGVVKGSGHRDRWYKSDMKISPKTVEERVQKKQPYIHLDYSTYTDTNTKARFIDEKYGEWWAKPGMVMQGRGHPDRGIEKRRIPSTEIEKRIKKIKPHLSLVHSTYTHTHAKAKFIDAEYGEFWACPSNIIVNGMDNSERSRAKRKLTPETVEKRVQKHNPFITLVHDTYVNTSTKAQFIDRDYGIYWAIPSHVMAGIVCRKRAGNLKLTPKQVQDKIQKDRPFISLDFESYSNLITKARFIDKVYGEWWAVPADVVAGHGHTRRGYDRYMKSKDEIKNILDDIPELELDYSTYKNVSTIARFIDKEHGEWWATLKTVAAGSRHPKRSPQSLISVDEVESRIQETRPWIKIKKETYTNTHTTATFIDEKYGEWNTRANYLLYKNVNHPNRMNSITDIEKILSNIFNINKYDRTVPEFDGPRIRPDFKIADSIYLDADGLYWHSELTTQKSIHFERREHFERNGLRLFQFRSDEIHNKPEIIKSIVLSAKNEHKTKVYAISTKIIDYVPQEFFKENHLLGYIKAKAVALIYKDKIVSALSYKIIKGELHIQRFCNKTYTSVVGSFAKLLNYVVKKHEIKGKIVNFVDLRYSTGDHLLKLGFNHVSTHLSFRWTDFTRTFNKLECASNMDDRKLSEQEYAKELKWYKIYDAGQAKFVKVLK